MATDTYINRVWYAPSQADYWAQQSVISGTSLVAAPSEDSVQWSTVSLVFTRTLAAGISDDLIFTSFNFAFIVGGGITTALTSGQKATIETALGTMWGTLKAFHPQYLTLSEYRWHDFTTSPTKPGPATRVTSVAVAGTGAATLRIPDQVATSVTYKTCSRLHWGRSYMPQLDTTSSYTTTGRIVTSRVDSYVAAVHTMVASADAASSPLVVPSRGHRALSFMRELQMDDVADVVQRRRLRLPAYRKSYTS